MNNSVLCAVDISNPDDEGEVVKKAAQLAALESAQLDVITVVPDFGMSVVGTFFEDGHQDKALEAAKAALNKLVSEALGSEQNERVRHIVATGSAYAEILNAAKMAGSSLIVVGAHKSDLKDFLLGPNAARVVRHSTCSVHVVRS